MLSHNGLRGVGGYTAFFLSSIQFSALLSTCVSNLKAFPWIVPKIWAVEQPHTEITLGVEIHS